jgi:outer membrane lipoprotein-sorting protein
VKPETFAGAIYVIDRKTNQVMQYSPITEQVIVSGIDQVISERFVPTTVEQLFSLPSPEDYNLTIVGTETKGNQTLINVSAKPKKNGDNTTFSFWIDQSQWFVQRMKVYGSDGKLLFTINLSDIKTNQNLTEAALKKMPPGAMTIYR